MRHFLGRRISYRWCSLIFVIMISAGTVVSGCSQQVKPENPEGSSTYKAIAPNGAAQYELQDGQSFSRPNLQKRVDPVYPGELVNANLKPLDIVAQVIVSELGRVSEVRFANYLGDNTNRGKFEQSIREAVSKWEYSPLTFTTTQIDSNGQKVSVTQTKPFSLWYMFHFEIKNGRPVSGVAESNDSSSAQ
jgi:hypothetical protein